MKVKVKIDKAICIGSGSCIVAASEYFALNDDGKAEIKKSKQESAKGSDAILTVKQGIKEKLFAAARSCPVQAISIMDEKGKKIYP